MTLFVDWGCDREGGGGTSTRPLPGSSSASKSASSSSSAKRIFRSLSGRSAEGRASPPKPRAADAGATPRRFAARTIARLRFLRLAIATNAAPRGVGRPQGFARSRRARWMIPRVFHESRAVVMFTDCGFWVRESRCPGRAFDSAASCSRAPDTGTCALHFPARTPHLAAHRRTSAGRGLPPRVDSSFDGPARSRARAPFDPTLPSRRVASRCRTTAPRPRARADAPSSSSSASSATRCSATAPRSCSATSDGTSSASRRRRTSTWTRRCARGRSPERRVESEPDESDPRPSRSHIASPHLTSRSPVDEPLRTP